MQILKLHVLKSLKNNHDLRHSISFCFLTSTVKYLADWNSFIAESGFNEDKMFVSDYTSVETAIAAAVLFVILIICLLGNIVICFVVFRNRRLWTEMNLFVVNLAIGDIALSLISMTVPLETVIARDEIFITGTLCQINAFCNSVLFCNTIFTHTAISIDRYLAVVKPMKKIMSKKKALCALVVVWTLAIAIALGPQLGWGRNTYNASTLQCGFGFPRDPFESLYIICLGICTFLLPIAIMSYVYSRIYFVVLHHNRRLSTSTSSSYYVAAIQQQRKTVLTFFLALIVFIICWTPFAVFMGLGASTSSRDELPRGLGIAAYWCGYLNSAINPYLIGLRSGRFYEAFSRFFCCLCHQCNHNSGRQQENNSCVATAETKHNTQAPTKGRIHSFTNSAAVNHEETAVPSLHAQGISTKSKIKQSYREDRDKTAMVYPHFIHMVNGKLWSEATV